MTGLTAAAPATRSTEEKTEARNAAVESLRDAYLRWSESKGVKADCWNDIVAENMKFGSLSAGAAHVANMSGGGRAGLQAFLEGLAKSWVLMSLSIDEFIASENSIVMRGRVVWYNKRTGKTFSSAKMDYWQFRGGKFVEFFEVCDTAGIQAAASD